MKKIIGLISIFYFNQIIACDILSPIIELEKAKESIEYESVSSFIPNLVSKKKVSIKNQPKWIYLNSPKEINSQNSRAALLLAELRFLQLLRRQLLLLLVPLLFA